ncbi:hypothetical protein I7I48_09930 [Histoplasma ohiense]|nr:hypothetical protein I7I48_09930 [Histoplasma ohiense (nom. inval.)]
MQELLSYTRRPHSIRTASTCISSSWLRWQFMTWRQTCLPIFILMENLAGNKSPWLAFKKKASCHCRQCAISEAIFIQEVYMTLLGTGLKLIYLEASWSLIGVLMKEQETSVPPYEYSVTASKENSTYLLALR